MRYYTLELMSSLLALPSKLVSDNFDVNKAKILYLLEVNSTVNQTFISRNPWNNMVHRLVESIVVNIVNSFESYAESEDTYIGEKGFLGFLIETFKNHDYMFLNRYRSEASIAASYPRMAISTTCTTLEPPFAPNSRRVKTYELSCRSSNHGSAL